MTFFYPDTSDYQGDISYAGCIAVCSKAGENLSEDPYFASSKTRAANAGAYLFAYWLIHETNATAQAQKAFSVVGTIPLMVDVEQVGNSNPGVTDTAEFLAEFAALGGHCHLLYLPHWYWQDNIGSPDFSPLAPYGMFLVTSDYTSYSDSGPGWNGYGGLTVLAWQYTSTASLNGVHPVDYNSCKVSLLDFESYVTTGDSGGTEPTLVEGDTGAAVILLQQRLNVWGYKLGTPDGDFGPVTLAAVDAFQLKEFGKTGVDGIVGPNTWTALLKNPSGLVAYPVPGALKPWSTNLYVTWNEVKIPAPDTGAGNPVPSYTIQTLVTGGAVVNQQVVTTTNAVVSGLSFGVDYTIRVWSNGGPIAPDASEFTITIVDNS